MLTISVDDAVSLQQLAAMKNKRESVVHVTHIGNQSAANMAVLAAGIPMVQYEYIVGKNDRTYQPHNIVRYGQVPEQLCDENVLVPSNVAKLHLGVLEQVVPDANISLFSEYLGGLEEHGLSVLDVLKQMEDRLGGESALWTQFVGKNGTVEKRAPQNWAHVMKEGVYGVTNSNQGWLIPNIINVLLVLLCEVKRSKRTEVHILLTKQMTRYLMSMTKDAYAIWKHMASLAGVSRYIKYVIHPISDIQFVTTSTRAYLLDNLLLTIDSLRSIRSSKHGRVAHVLPEHRLAIEQNVRFALAHCPEVLPKQEHGGYCLTHHDFADKGLYVPTWTLSKPLRAHKKAQQRLVIQRGKLLQVA